MQCAEDINRSGDLADCDSTTKIAECSVRLTHVERGSSSSGSGSPHRRHSTQRSSMYCFARPTSHIPGTSRLAAWISHFAAFSLPTCLLLTSFGFPPSLDGSLNVEAQTSRGELRRCVASSTRSELDGLVRSLLFLFCMQDQSTGARATGSLRSSKSRL